MKVRSVLSICIPVFNRKKKLLKLLNTVDCHNGVEIIIVDDGSQDNLQDLLKNYNFSFKIKYYKNLNNQGRSAALADTIKYASGDYILIMDSDDFFLPGALNLIKLKIKENKLIKSFLFGLKIKKNKKVNFNLPPANVISNFLKIRADYQIKGDLKEVVEAKILKKSIYKKAYKFRRTPTSIMWLNVSKRCKCLSIDIPIIVKTYNKYGMTSLISKLKFQNAQPMYDLYYGYSRSKLYNSSFFRFRSKILFYRYLYLSKKKLNIKYRDILPIILGYILYIKDIFNFSFLKRNL